VRGRYLSRRQAVKQREAQLTQSKARVVDAVSKLLGQRDRLRPYDFAADKFQLRAEMRAVARTMKEADVMTLAKTDPAFSEALVEAQPWMSGIAPSQHALLTRAALELRHGPLLRELERGIASAEAVLELHKVVERAIANEKVTVGAVEPPSPPTPTPTARAREGRQRAS
jgi:hypothetical protein